ncbi:hypothetical protein [Curtobacterium sp. MCBD17_040]|uniref:hypothetical protein n=1 Tax=Curtobacterium sp. MCBD17_040 TaxID=2175674 RepID=UPI000DAAB2DB|nr:hypothetical protein [Curtobacterium sp. MCBD17_040]WIB65401.1 hypothetical protein DEI94_18515 [Curtobacterium sp. MCBD17_040]
MRWFTRDASTPPAEQVGGAPPTATDRYRDGLDQLAAAARQASAVISPAAFSTLRRIDDVLRPMVNDLEGCSIPAEQDVAVQQFIHEFVPDTLTLFLGLPAADQADGGRGDQMLVEQLTAVEQAAADLADRAHGDAFNGMEVNALFLREALR